MKIITDINTPLVGCTAATIGSFDGVHRGHLAMIDEARSRAEQMGVPLTVITFARHPRVVFNNIAEPFLLTSNDEKMELLQDAGVDSCVLLEFDKSMASLTAKEFMHDILLQKLNVSLLIAGYDHRFGTPQQGEGFDNYVEYGKAMSMQVMRAAQFAPNGIKISSSAVRRALSQGDVEQAALMLGRRYSLCGTVVHGAALGRSIGFPTANISLHEPLKLLPADGVYECVLHHAAQSFKGVMNIGCKPTLNGDKRTIEVFIIGFEGNIYGSETRVEFVRRLREERRFASIDDLRKQIELDVNNVKSNNY